ncbi:MAG: lipocalin-like domain-containing protein [Thermoplasmata archaeon]
MNHKIPLVVVVVVLVSLSMLPLSLKNNALEAKQQGNGGENTPPQQNEPSWKNYPYKDGVFMFPYDEGVHPEATTEWWYVNGHLSGNDGGRYHFMASFFIHNTFSASILDEKTKTYYNYSQMFPEVSKKTGELNLKYQENSFYQIQGAPFKYHLEINTPQFSVDITMDASKKPLIVNGDGIINTGNGYSYYYALTNLSAVGSVKLNSNEFAVTGDCWLDRQWGTWNAFNGWEWFSIKLDNGMQILASKMFAAKDENTFQQFVSVMDSAENVYNFGRPYDTLNFVIDYNDYWYSNKTGNLYSSGWNLTIPLLKIRLDIAPIIKAQEIIFPKSAPNEVDDLSFWEGACNVSGELNGTRINGVAYTELAYDYGRIEGDLTVRSVKIKQDLFGNYNVEIDVENQGGESLKNVCIEILDGSPYDGGTILEKYFLVDASNQTHVHSKITSEIEHQIFVIIDPDNLVAEKNEKNNFFVAEPEK